jgi:hypothetical protein
MGKVYRARDTPGVTITTGKPTAAGGDFAAHCRMITQPGRPCQRIVSWHALVARNGFVREVLGWFDEYLGPALRLQPMSTFINEGNRSLLTP